MQIVWDTAAVELQTELWVAGPETTGTDTLHNKGHGDLWHRSQPGETHSGTQQEIRTQQEEPRLLRIWTVGVLILRTSSLQRHQRKILQHHD